MTQGKIGLHRCDLSADSWNPSNSRQALPTVYLNHSEQSILNRHKSTLFVHWPASHSIGKIKMTLQKIIAFTIAFLVTSTAFAAQAYPSRPITLIVPYPTGGAVDPVARMYGQKLSEAWGVPVIIKNIPGAGGTIGINQAAKAKPDGYTVVLSAGSLTSYPWLYENLPFDPSKDFTYIGLAVGLTVVLAANPRLPVNSLFELVEYAKKNPGKLNYSTTGNGSLSHIGMELFKQMTTINILHIPYKGSGPATLAAVSGEVDLVFDTHFSLSPHVNAGKLKFVASTGKKRAETTPDIPTFSETYPGYLVESWFGFIGPANIPAEITKKWADEIVRINKLPEFRVQLQKTGLDPIISTPDEFSKNVRADMLKWKKVIEEAKIPKLN